MVNQLFTILFQLVMIYWSYSFLLELVDWSKILRVTPQNSRNAQVFLVFLAITLGFLVSSFFLNMIDLARFMTSNWMK